jgi:hypothetical protein
MRGQRWGATMQKGLTVLNRVWTRYSLFGTVGLWVCLASATGQVAEAKGIVLITRGDSIAHVGDLPAATAAQIRQEIGKDLAVGFKYSYAGVFWLDFWTWGGEYCLFEDMNYDPLTPDKAAELLGISTSQLGRPWQYNYPLGLIILIAIGVIALAAKLLIKTDAQRGKALLQDARYIKALEVFQQAASKSDTAAEANSSEQIEAMTQSHDRAVAAAVDYLQSQGIDATTARNNLLLLMRELGSAQAA